MGWKVPGADKIECKDLGFQARLLCLENRIVPRSECFFFFSLYKYRQCFSENTSQ